tara:strand:+ start:8967 stop:9560 length:594 start_codon:yes stop_codon:yes gene_type:complete
MSSTSAPFGFRPSYHNSGRITAKAYVIATGYAQNIFQGDPVKLTDDGVIQLATSDGTRSGTTDGISMLGIFAGVQYNDSTGKPSLSPFWPASTAGTEIVAWVYDDPETIYDVQYTNPSSGTTIQTAVGEQCDWTVASPGGSTQVGLSSTQLTAIQATSGQFQITGIAGGPDNGITDAYVTVTVRINESQYKAPVNSV